MTENNDQFYNEKLNVMRLSADLHALAFSFKDIGDIFMYDKLSIMSENIVEGIMDMGKIHDAEVASMQR